MTTTPTLVILAAGIGRRYGGLKQLEPVGPGGEALLEYSIFDALRAGFERVVLVIRPEIEHAFRRFLGARLADGIALSYVFQELSDVPDGVVLPTGRTKPWGTGQAVLAAEGEIHGPFAVVNADDFYGSDSFATLGAFLKTDHGTSPPTFALAGFRVGPTLSDSGPVSRGLCRIDGAGWLEDIVEVLEIEKRGTEGFYRDASGIGRIVPGDDLVSMNMWGFTPAVFPELRVLFREFLSGRGTAANGGSEFLLPDAIRSMIDNRRARVRVLRHDGRWCGITFPEDRQRAKGFVASLVARGGYPRRLWT